MKALIHGRICQPAVAVVGSWDPFVQRHQALFKRLRDYARMRGYAAVAIMIDPSPSIFLRGRAEWPIYDDAKTRVQLMLRTGIDAVLQLRFFKSDLHKTALDFFEVICPQLQLAEMWLGTQQTLGPGSEGNPRAIKEITAERGIGVTHLPPERLGTANVRAMLSDGRVVDATNFVGRPPIRSRPKSGRLQFAWTPGRYQALPVTHLQAPVSGSPLELKLTASDTGLSQLEWPDRAVKYLAFVSGPGDAKTAFFYETTPLSQLVTEGGVR